MTSLRKGSIKLTVLENIQTILLGFSVLMINGGEAFSCNGLIPLKSSCMDPFQVWLPAMATHTKSIAGGHWWAIENPITAHDLKSVDRYHTCKRAGPWRPCFPGSKLSSRCLHVHFREVSGAEHFCKLFTGLVIIDCTNNVPAPSIFSNSS